MNQLLHGFAAIDVKVPCCWHHSNHELNRTDGANLLDFSLICYVAANLQGCERVYSDIACMCANY